MNTLNTEHKIYYTLRIAAAMCFIGHGSFGIITKAIWCNYFAVFGIGHDMAYHLMPIVGSIDIWMGLSLLFYPVRAIAFWLVIWGFITACFRPLSGEPFAELLERAGNFGAPLALLLLCASQKEFWRLFQRLKTPANVSAERLKQVQICLKWAAFLLLAGHGWLNLIDKKSMLRQYASMGFHNTQQVALTVGITEISMAMFVLFKPMRPMLLIFLVWKMGTELFYPHYELFEWVERGGSYGTLLALWFSLKPSASSMQVNKHPVAVV